MSLLLYVRRRPLHVLYLLVRRPRVLVLLVRSLLVRRPRVLVLFVRRPCLSILYLILCPRPCLFVLFLLSARRRGPRSWTRRGGRWRWQQCLGGRHHWPRLSKGRRRRRLPLTPCSLCRDPIGRHNDPGPRPGRRSVRRARWAPCYRHPSRPGARPLTRCRSGSRARWHSKLLWCAPWGPWCRWPATWRRKSPGAGRGRWLTPAANSLLFCPCRLPNVWGYALGAWRVGQARRMAPPSQFGVQAGWIWRSMASCARKPFTLPLLRRMTLLSANRGCTVIAVFWTTPQMRCARRIRQAAFANFDLIALPSARWSCLQRRRAPRLFLSA